LPVIRVYHANPEYGPEPGTVDFAFPDSVIIDENDPMIVKSYPSSFTKTELDELLKEKGCNTLYLCGLSAVGCVFATYHGAIEREYDVFMVKGALMSHKEDYTDMVEDITGAVSYTAMKAMLKYTQE
jgi:nicotinamidase-related amidase